MEAQQTFSAAFASLQSSTQYTSRARGEQYLYTDDDGNDNVKNILFNRKEKLKTVLGVQNNVRKK